jgi:hypothetical protein
MQERVPQWVYVVIGVLLVVVAVLATKTFTRTDGERLATAPIQSARDLPAQAPDSEIGQLRKEVQESSNRVKQLETRLEETNRALGAAQEKLKTVQRPVAAPPPPAPAKEQPIARSPEPAPPPYSRPPAEPGQYEVIRTTTVFDRPSPSGRDVASITRGTRVTVVGSEGDWLEVRSKQGRPPGFIKRDDAMFAGRSSESR